MDDHPDTPLNLDYSGLSCPLPVLKAQKAFQSLATGTVVAIQATDPAAPRDFKQFCEAHGHQWLGQEDLGTHFLIMIEKA